MNARTSRPRRPGSRRRTSPTPLTTAVVIVVSAVLVVAGAAVAERTRGVDTTGLTSTASHGTALAALGTLTVKGRAPKTGYTREQFGQAWADVDGNGCDTRDDVLARDLHDTTTRRGDPCIITSGVLDDPYAPKTIHFVRGPDSAAVQIDHVVALSDAWQTGAQRWSAATRRALANDPLNLLAVDGPLNSAKGDGDAATWLPPNKAFRCTYVARQVAVKAKYGAWVTAAERDAMAKVLATCPDQQLPDGDDGVGPATTGSGSAGSGSAATSAPAAASRAAGATASAVVSYASCAQASAAGAAPLHSGDPGYSRRLDRDGDGTACG